MPKLLRYAINGRGGFRPSNRAECDYDGARYDRAKDYLKSLDNLSFGRYNSDITTDRRAAE